MKASIDYSDVFNEGLSSFDEKEVEDTGMCNLLEKLTSKAYPDNKDEYDTRWSSFYLPLKKENALFLFLYL